MSLNLALIRDMRATRCGSPTAKAVAMAMAIYANGRGVCFPSFVTLSEVTEFSPRAVKGAIVTLQGAGIVEIVRGGGRGKSNSYRLTPKPETVQEVHPLNGEGDAPFYEETVQHVPQTVQHVPQTVQEVHTNYQEEPITTNNRDTGAKDDPPSKPKKATPKTARIPDDWRPTDDAIAKAIEAGIPEDKIDDEVFQFIEFWQGVQRAAGKKSDRGWGLTWGNNVARVVGLRYRGQGPRGSDFRSIPGGGGQPSGFVAAGQRYLDRQARQRGDGLG